MLPGEFDVFVEDEILLLLMICGFEICACVGRNKQLIYQLFHACVCI